MKMKKLPGFCCDLFLCSELKTNSLKSGMGNAKFFYSSYKKIYFNHLPHSPDF